MNNSLENPHPSKLWKAEGKTNCKHSYATNSCCCGTARTEVPCTYVAYVAPKPGVSKYLPQMINSSLW